MGRRLPIVVVLVIAAVVAIALGLRPDGSTPTPNTATPRTVPQLLWMTPAQAGEVLGDADLDLRRVGDERCDVPPGRVTGTTPPAGEPVPEGGIVQVRVSATPAVARCAYRATDRLASRLLDLARFGSRPPRFADEVEVHVDGRLVRRLSAEEARDPSLWGDPSPLRWLASASVLPEIVGVSARPVQGDRPLCDPDELAVDLRARPSVQLQVLPEIPPTASWVSCSSVRVFRDGRGRVDAVAVTGLGTSISELIVD